MWALLLVLEQEQGHFAEAAELCIKLGDLDGAIDMHTQASAATWLISLWLHAAVIHWSNISLEHS